MTEEVLYLKESIIKESQDYYNASLQNEKEKYKESLQKKLKRFHYYRKSNQEDYKLIKKIIENIT